MKKKLSLLLLGSSREHLWPLRRPLSGIGTFAGVVVSREEPHPWLKGRRLSEVAQNHGIPVYLQSEVPAETRVTLVVSYMYRHRVKARTLQMAETAALNFHAAPLPEYGGWGFITWLS